MIKKLKLLVALAVTSVVIGGQHVSAADNTLQRFYYNGHLYAICNNPTAVNGMRWLETYAEGLGGHLVYIESTGENQFVGSLIQKYGGLSSYAIGTYKSAGVWKYYDGRNLVYSNWGSGEPNNYGGCEDYGEMIPSTDSYWNDIPNISRGAEAGAIIEWDNCDEVFRVDCGYNTVRQGDIVDVSIVFNNSENMSNVRYSLDYDTNLFEFEKSEAAEGLRIKKRLITNNNMIVNICSEDKTPIDSGKIVTLTFRAKATGSSDFKFREAAASNSKRLKVYKRYDCVPKTISII